MLADFGIAKVAASERQPHGDRMSSIGTPHYMSPEQALGARTVDERSDIYSLGAVAYTMLAGREPFSGGEAVQVMRRRIAQSRPPLRAARSRRCRADSPPS